MAKYLRAGRQQRRALREADGSAGSAYPYFPSDYEPCTSDWATTYLSRKDVQAALHAEPGGPTWTGNWSACANLKYSNADVGAPMMPVYKKLLQAKPRLKMAIMSGDDDTVCATLGTQQVRRYQPMCRQHPVHLYECACACVCVCPCARVTAVPR